MRWSEIGGVTCSVARALSLVGESWTLMILREAFLGSRRFDEFQRYLHISPYILSERLGKLVAHGILERRCYHQHPPRYGYCLTAKGRDLYPVILALARWGDRWLAGQEGPPLRFVHKDCGHTFTPVLTCSACGDAVEARDVRAAVGARMEAEREASKAGTAGRAKERSLGRSPA